MSFDQDQSSDNSDDHSCLEQSKNLYTLKRYESTDSLSAWDLSEYTKTEYALRKISLECTTKQIPSIYIDRQKLDEVFQQNEDSRGQRSRTVLNLRKYNRTHKMKKLNTRFKRTIKASFSYIKRIYNLIKYSSRVIYDISVTNV